MDLVVARAIQRQQLGAQVGGERDVAMGEHLERRRAAGREVDQDAVDAVERGARHQADEQRCSFGTLRASALRHSPSGAARRAHRRRRLTRRGLARAASVWATPSWARTLCDSWAKLRPGGRRQDDRASEVCATSSGSCCTPSILTSKCRCGPVAQPVWPTAPIVCALLDALALGDVDAAQVGIDRRQVARCLLDLDDVAVAVLPAGELDDAVADGPHRRAGRRAVVDAVVLLPGVEDRMHAHREARGHARELERAGEERALLALAVEAEVAALAVAVLEPHRRVGLVLVDELGGEDPAGRRRCPR